MALLRASLSAATLLGAAATAVANPKAAQPKTIVELQAEQTSETQAPEGMGSATLVNLSPGSNSWFLLKIRWADAKREQTFHLENPFPQAQNLRLPAEGSAGLVIEGKKASHACDIWAKDVREAIKKTIIVRTAYTPICEGRLYVRQRQDGRKTTKEIVVEFLRDSVWGGEQITTFVKEKILKDTFLIKSDTTGGESDVPAVPDTGMHPANALVDAKQKDLLMEPKELGIKVPLEGGKLRLGHWYEHEKAPGVYVSGMIPSRIDESILSSHKDLVTKLDAVEAQATVYLVAFDLTRFDLGFAMGTDHPRVDWAARALKESVDRSIPGPDGIANWEPLATTGVVSPANAKRIVATFTGGFKRDHAAFKWGKLSGVNGASHYGVLEAGVVFSRLNPDLSTLYVRNDGTVDMRTWGAKDDPKISEVRYARQNGVAIIEYDDAKKASMPGELIKSWGGGNWSGSEDSKFRTLRAGVCMQYHEKRPYLIYGYFSSVTPSAMARVFQAYKCRYAMHLDMNALEHTYLAVYPTDGKAMAIEHLISGMRVLDKSYQKTDVPRFVGFPDNRDFFYLTRKAR